MEFKNRTLSQIADLICGNFIKEESFFRYRSSMFLTEFFRDVETDYEHDGSTRGIWVGDTLKLILQEPSSEHKMPSDTFIKVIQVLMDQSDANNEDSNRAGALGTLNTVLLREGFEAFYAEDRKCYLKHIASQKILKPSANPHRPFTTAESKRRGMLSIYLNSCSEDELIEEILLPLFRQLGYYRITAAGHKDKSLEYGKDIWMKFMLPSLHMLYFGIQVKKGKLDAAGMSKSTNANVAEIYNQVLMMLGHEIFDPEIGKNVLVDHAFIVAGGEITKSAKNWLAGKLDTSKRSQVMFMDRDDILNLFIVNNLPLPVFALLKEDGDDDDLPF
ncbi:hypothetical protein [Pedobacter gandavensis]|uniref:hypothetical protein n=1 Tax=Pedobacter gandavensis TaxID=2679963 RepID=UPI00292CECB2|nr:hypothetical protein [Pedobacter gandavensis]